MGLELMPDGATFKKLNSTQKKALDTYYKRLHDKPLSQDLALPLGLVILGGIGAMAYIFKDDIKKEFEEQKEALWDWVIGGIKSLPAKTFGWSVEQGFDIGKIITGIDLSKPSGEAAEVFGPDVNICSQYEYDLINLRNRDPFWPWEKIAVGTAIQQKLSGMKQNGCSRPPFIDEKNWDRA